MTQPSFHAIVSGRVQGVNFRYYTHQRARQLGLLGWVQNLPDGTVAVLAEGPRAALDQLADFLQHGPPPAHVTNAQLEWSTASGQYHTFSIRA